MLVADSMATLDYYTPEPQAETLRRRQARWLGVWANAGMGVTFVALVMTARAAEARWWATRVELLAPVVLDFVAVLIFVGVLRKARRVDDVIEWFFIGSGLLLAAAFVIFTAVGLAYCRWWYVFTSGPWTH
jgi:hypothetical protein